MPHPLRYHPPDAVFEVVHRTIEGEFLLRPSLALNARIEAVLARAQRLYGVELFNYNFQSNHPHIMGRARDLRSRSDFLKHVFRNIAVAAREVNGGTGPVWAGRAKIRIVLDDRAYLQRMHYISANGVKEGLVETPLLWPGASAAGSLYHQRNLVTSWRTADERRRVARGVDVQGECNLLRLSPVPAHARMSRAQRKRVFRKLFAEITAEGRKLRRGRKPLGAEAVLAQSPRTRVRLERRGAPLAFASSPSLLAEFEQGYRAYGDWYRSSAQRLKLGELAALFPPGSLPPPRPFEDRGLAGRL